MFYINLSHNLHSTHARWCNKKVIVWLCVCKRDNPLAKARVLSSRACAQTIHQLKLVIMGSVNYA